MNARWRYERSHHPPLDPERITALERLAVADAKVMLGREPTPDERRVAIHVTHLLLAMILDLEDLCQELRRLVG